MIRAKIRKDNRHSKLKKLTTVSASCPSFSSGPHQQHHSAPPTHHQTARTGLDAINENVEYPTNIDQTFESNGTNHRFPRSSTVPYPAYATLRKTAMSAGYFSPPYYYYTDYPPSIVHETPSPDPYSGYFIARSPLASVNAEFQPISPHHQQYCTRPVDLLKPTFLIVPKAAEQRLAAQLSASNSPVLATHQKIKPFIKRSQSKPESKSGKNTTSSPKTNVRSVEVQTNSNHSSPAITALKPVPISSQSEMSFRHVGLLGTPNPSPYVYLGSPTYSRQSPPETSVLQDDSIQVTEYKPITMNSQLISNMPSVSGKTNLDFSMISIEETIRFIAPPINRSSTPLIRYFSSVLHNQIEFLERHSLAIRVVCYEF